ncbi:MAG TPA: murein biosynthesis integral membrane protein MurJ [Phycisphaerae bacterium]
MLLQKSRHGGQAFVGSAKIIAGWTLVSRITGLARDILLNAAFGQTWIQDAFNYGFLIPNLFRRLFGEGALSAVFVPNFTEALHRDGEEAAWQLLGKVLARMVAGLTALTFVLEALLLAIWCSRPERAMHQLILSMTAIMLPFMISICIVALFSSILNCLGHFGGPAAMSIVLNVCMIAGIVWLAPLTGADPQIRVYGVALSVLAAGVVQLALIWPMLRGAGVRTPLIWGQRDATMRAMGSAFVPVILGQGVLLLSSFLDTQICTFLSRGPSAPPQFQLFGMVFEYPLRAGALSAVTNAQRLYQFPLGVLAISLATAALPTLSMYAAQHNIGGLRTALGRGLRLAVFEGLPCGMILVVLAEPIIRLLFEHGHYTAEHTQRAAAVLRWYGLGVWAFCLQHVVLRGYYSLKDTRTPMWIGGGLVILNSAASFALIWHPQVRERAFGISTSLTAILNVLISLWLLRPKLGGLIGGRRLAVSFARTLAATALAAIAALILHRLLEGWKPETGRIFNRLVDVFVPIGAAALVYLAVAASLGMEEVRWLLRGSRSGLSG